MFQTICQIGPLTVAQYGATIAVIAVTGCVFLLGIYLSKGFRRHEMLAVVFWTALFVLAATVPLLFPVTIYSYGFMVALAVVLGTLTLAADARRKNIDTEIVFDLVFWSVTGGIVGARLFYVVQNYPYFMERPVEIIMIQNGGLAWQGGLVLGFISAATYIRAKKLSLPAVLDLVAPYLALGQSIGRIGCFLNGCCYGKPVAWGVYFPVHRDYLHPTQLYLTAGYLAIFILLKRYQRSSEIPGLTFALYLMLAAVLRFVVEFFRADHETLFLGLSIYQFISFGILLFSIGFAYVTLTKHSKPEDI